MLVYLLVNFPAVGLDVVMEPCHHGVPGTNLGYLSMLGKIKQKREPLTWALARSRAVLPLLSLRSSIHFLFSSRLR